VLTVLVIAAFGIVGNIVVMISMIRENLYRKTLHMSILVLAVTDVLSLILIVLGDCVYLPNESYFVEIFDMSNGICIAFFVLYSTPFLSSCLNVVFLAYERYVLATKPLVYQSIHTPNIVVIRAFVAFVLVAAVNIVYALIAVVVTGISKCPEFVTKPTLYGFVTFPLISAFWLTLIFFHSSKVSKLRKSASLKGRYTQNEKQLPNMTTVIYIIVIILIVSQIPYLVFDVFVILEYFELFAWPSEFMDILLPISIIIFMINYASNPFIYWITPLRCRQNLKTSKSYKETTNSSIKRERLVFKFPGNVQSNLDCSQNNSYDVNVKFSK
jgi:hypothetical protein